MIAKPIKLIPHEVTFEQIDTIVGQPWAPAGIAQGEKDIMRPVLSEKVDEPVKFQPRGFKILRSMIDKFGLTEGSRKCRLMLSGDKELAVPHTSTCRMRMENAMRGDDVLRKRVEAMDERKNRYLAEHIASAQGPKQEVREEVRSGSSASPSQISAPREEVQREEEVHETQFLKRMATASA